MLENAFLPVMHPLRMKLDTGAAYFPLNNGAVLWDVR